MWNIYPEIQEAKQRDATFKYEGAGIWKKELLHTAELKTRLGNKEEAVFSSIKEDLSNVSVVH